jgi:predicted DNA binding CopG/RHH family protein
MSDKIVVPNFASESEEADWWFEHREEHGEIMAKAIEEGRTMTMQQVLEQSELQSSRVAVELDFDDVVRARKQAQARGIDYQVYMRELLHQALVRNDAA